MRTGIDATPLTAVSGGVARYTYELSRALAARFPEDEFWLLSDQSFAYPGEEIQNLKRGTGPANRIERRWWLWGLQGAIRRHRVDVFHGTDFAAPYLPVRPSVMTLHDLSPWLDPRWHTGAGRIRRRTPLLLRLGRVTMVVTPTEAVRKAAMERFHIPGSRIVAVPHGANPRFHPVEAPAREAPYFLFVGTLEPRKNLRLLMEAWREVRKAHAVDLVFAGRVRRDFCRLPEEPGMIFLGTVEEEKLPGLYAGARAVVYPSLYEGFGLPVLEAMQCGAMVITSRDAAIREVADEGALCVEAEDRKAWVEAMTRAAVDAEWVRGWRERGLKRAAQFSWTRTAELTREVYVEAQRRFRRG
jgi:glycosyltransferase involved in cell wall biosynthesis